MDGQAGQVRFRLVGERGLMAEYGDVISPEINRRVRRAFMDLEGHRPAGVVEVVPTYRSLLVSYDPATVDMVGLKARLAALATAEGELAEEASRLVEIPVCYGGDHGPDLEFVAQNAGLDPDEVIARHADPVYMVYMIGFSPGYPFLGGLDPRLSATRLPSPRLSVPAGSVGIANDQTGIYPVESPGGWRLIGRTPLKVFDPRRADPFLIKASDRVRFRPIDRDAFAEMGREASS